MIKPVETKKLSKRFNLVDAVKAIDLKVEPGTVYGLLGRNGAGKTTLLRMLLGIIKPTSGTATIFGENFASCGETLRQRVAYIGQEYRFYNGYTLELFINMIAPLYPKWNWGKSSRLLKDFELEIHKRLGEMSGGQRQKVAMLVAFSCGAELLVLDEPASALDPLSRRMAMGEMMNFIGENPEVNTIIFSTHIVNDLERVATRVGMMDSGRITHEFELDSIHENMRKVQVVFKNDDEAGFEFKNALSVSKENRVVSAIYDFGCESSLEELKVLKESDIQFNSFPLNLEEFFVQIYGQNTLTTID